MLLRSAAGLTAGPQVNYPSGKTPTTPDVQRDPADVVNLQEAFQTKLRTQSDPAVKLTDAGTCALP